MTVQMNNHTWPFPGSRWWKFDFHTHTPASQDTRAWQKAVGTKNEVTPEKWLLKFMGAGIDCVAVTDHNSGDWIDSLKKSYQTMRQRAKEGNPPDGFRALTLFPGVEISVNGGFHLLAIFDPESTAVNINDLLAVVEYQGTKGDSDGVTKRSSADVVEAVLSAGAIPIPAHCDGDKGLLRTERGTRKSALDPQTVRQVMESEGLLAVEKLDPNIPSPDIVAGRMGEMATVLGSDCHSFQGSRAPGSRYTWIKMSRPTLEGLRLALLDGDQVSVRRSDDGQFEPFQTPDQFITSIEIDSARFMGNGTPERIGLSPYYNAIIGGRGTGKSSIVHAVRLAYRRGDELKQLGETSEPCRSFKSFAEPARGRDGDGALREKTQIRICLFRDGTKHSLQWHQDGKGDVVEEQREDKEFRVSASQAVNPERFPIRLFSQGQVAAMAGEGRQALLSIIDEAAGVGELHKREEEAKRTYLSQRAKLREIDGRLQERPELERKLNDLNRKLETLQQSQHAEILKAYQKTRHQQREVTALLDQLQAVPSRIKSLAQELLLDDWEQDVFDPSKEQSMLSWRGEVERALQEAKDSLHRSAQLFEERVGSLTEDDRVVQWLHGVEQAQKNYEVLQATFVEQRVADPQAFSKLIQSRQELARQVAVLEELRTQRNNLKNENLSQWKKVLEARKCVTEARENFIRGTLAENSFVRMEVVGFGFDARSIERELRALLDCEDERFETDLLSVGEERQPDGGLAFDIAEASDNSRYEALENAKQSLIAPTENRNMGGHFRNFLAKKLESPGFEDQVRCWFPEDDLRIEYSRTGEGGNWSRIEQGSQGQRSAALLAFLLAFGNEPLVLDQPEDDLDNHLIYELIVRQIRENKLRRQLIVVTHNPNILVNGDAEMVHALDFRGGQCRVVEHGALQEAKVREEVCRVMEGGREAFARRWARLGREV